MIWVVLLVACVGVAAGFWAGWWARGDHDAWLDDERERRALDALGRIGGGR